MRRIFKYTIHIADKFSIEFPKGFQILRVACQDGVPRLWALIDDTSHLSEYDFRIVGTGHPVPEGIGPYIDTFQEGQMVWHLFEAGAS